MIYECSLYNVHSVRDAYLVIIDFLEGLWAHHKKLERPYACARKRLFEICCSDSWSEWVLTLTRLLMYACAYTVSRHLPTPRRISLCPLTPRFVVIRLQFFGMSTSLQSSILDNWKNRAR